MNLLAQIPDPSAWLAPLAGTGIIGLVLKYFMGKNDANFKELGETIKEASKESSRRLIGVENSNNRQTRALLMLTLSFDKSPAAKREAGVITAETEKAEKHELPSD